MKATMTEEDWDYAESIVSPDKVLALKLMRAISGPMQAVYDEHAIGKHTLAEWMLAMIQAHVVALSRCVYHAGEISPEGQENLDGTLQWVCEQFYIEMNLAYAKGADDPTATVGRLMRAISERAVTPIDVVVVKSPEELDRLFKDLGI